MRPKVRSRFFEARQTILTAFFQAGAWALLSIAVLLVDHVAAPRATCS